MLVELKQSRRRQRRDRSAVAVIAVTSARAISSSISLSDGFFRLDGGVDVRHRARSRSGSESAADERNRITLAMRPLVVRGVRTMLIDAGLGDKEDDEVPRHLRRRARATPRSRAGGGGPRARRHRHRARDAICTSTMPAASRCATRDGRCVRAFRARATSCARRVGGRDASARAQPRQLPGGQFRAAGGGRRARIGRRRPDDHARGARAAHRRPHDAPSDGVDRIAAASTAAFLGRSDADDRAPAGRRGSWASTCIRWTRWRASRRSCGKRSSARSLVFFEHDPWSRPATSASSDGRQRRASAEQDSANDGRRSYDHRHRHHRRQRPVRHGRADRPRGAERSRRRLAIRRARTSSARCAASASRFWRGTASAIGSCRRS